MTRQLAESETEPVREDARRFLASRPDLRPADLATQTILAESTVRSFIRGDIAGGREVIAELTRVLQQARAGDILQPGGGTDRRCLVIAEDDRHQVRRVVRRGAFYTTETVKRIAEVLDYCAEHCAIGVATCDFGCGKTEAVKAWRASHCGVQSLVMECDEFTSHNKIDFVRVLGRMFGLESAPERPVQKLFPHPTWQVGQEIHNHAQNTGRSAPCVYGKPDRGHGQASPVVVPHWDTDMGAQKRGQQTGMVLLSSAPWVDQRRGEPSAGEGGCCVYKFHCEAPGPYACIS